MTPTDLARNVKVEKVLNSLRFTVPIWLLVAGVLGGLWQVREFMVATERRFARLERDTAKATMILDRKFPEESAEVDTIMRRLYRHESEAIQ